MPSAPFATTAIIEHMVANSRGVRCSRDKLAAHRSDEDRWARAQHDMKGSSRGQRPHDRKSFAVSWRSAEEE
jgi:hypothetical protein